MQDANGPINSSLMARCECAECDRLRMFLDNNERLEALEDARRETLAILYALLNSHN